MLDACRGLWQAAPMHRLFLLLLLLAAGPAQAEIAGKKPDIFQADRFELAGQTIQLYGLQAPRVDQTCQADGATWACGQEARWAAINRIGGHWISCIERGRGANGEIFAVCSLGGQGGPELNAWMVEQGWALAARHYANDYVMHEGLAKAARRGLWRSEFVAPWNWTGN